jgi:translation initiation factor IF-2
MNITKKELEDKEIEIRLRKVIYKIVEDNQDCGGIKFSEVCNRNTELYGEPHSFLRKKAQKIYNYAKLSKRVPSISSTD